MVRFLFDHDVLKDLAFVQLRRRRRSPEPRELS
jgi:hypothetical protein